MCKKHSDVHHMPSKPVAAAAGDVANIARDPEIATREEFELAVKAGTVAAIDLFIARHPQSELVAEAKDIRRKLASENITSERR
jgi:hypothetical protein